MKTRATIRVTQTEIPISPRAPQKTDTEVLLLRQEELSIGLMTTQSTPSIATLVSVGGKLITTNIPHKRMETVLISSLSIVIEGIIPMPCTNVLGSKLAWGTWT